MNDPRSPLPGGLPPDSDDELLLRQVRAVLTPMPTVDRRAIAQILSAVAEKERAPRRTLRARLGLQWDAALEWWRFSVPPFARGSALVTAALVVGFVVRGTLMDGTSANGTSRATPSATVASAPGAASPTIAAPTATALQAAASDPEARMVPVQFLLDAREVSGAASVSLVGDFNDWDAQATPLQRDAGAWTVTLPITPGRHVYAFVVDGERWVADPRAPRAPDADFGRPGSVVIVQTP